MKRICITFLALASLLAVRAADPMATRYSIRQCEGSLTPYPAEVPSEEHPDSLAAVFINHVGRHGARYPASSDNCRTLQRALMRADSLGTITQTGRDLLRLTNRVIRLTAGRWGALDSLGMAEQAQIATRMFVNFAEVLSAGNVKALSSYSPRAMMSMYSFLHQLDRLNNHLEFTTSTGRMNSPLMRPFDIDADYIEFRRAKSWEPAYNAHFEAVCPTTAIRRVLGEDFPFSSDAHARDAAITEYYVLAGLRAMGLPSQMQTYFTIEEANALWSCFNLRQYLQRTATTVSTVPAEIAGDLVLNIIETTDAYTTGEDTGTCAILRFGHAETLMPLLSLLRIPGCHYMTNYFDTVASHWRDFDVVPMAANIQFIVFKSRRTGDYYVRVDVNETPVALRPGDDSLYFPWGELRRFMMNCVPLHAQ